MKRYIVLDHLNNPDIPFKWLQAIDMPELAFVVTDPILFSPDYNPGIEEQDLRELNITNPLDLGIIVIVTIPHGEPEKMTANLQGPVLVNIKRRDAKQIILLDEKYPFHYPLFDISRVQVSESGYQKVNSKI